MKERLYVTQEETVQLIERCVVCNFVFGPGWVALDYDAQKPMPEDVRLLLLIRGVLNENMEGAGI